MNGVDLDQNNRVVFSPSGKVTKRQVQGRGMCLMVRAHKTA